MSIRIIKSFAWLVLFVTGVSFAQSTDQGKAVKEALQLSPAAQLSQSPRHHEWVDLKREQGTFKAFVVYPETEKPAKAVIVIHENRGLNDWARSFADQLAAKGYLVIAPDLISNTVEGKERTTDFEDSDKAREAIYALNPDQVTQDLNAAFRYIQSDPAASGEVAVIGFCWGGSQSFRYATNNPKLSEAFVFYGTAPKDGSGFDRISCPVYGFYGGNDNRVNATLDETSTQMSALGKTFEQVIYPGAGHAFMRRGEEAGAEPENKEAHDLAWKKLLELLP